MNRSLRTALFVLLAVPALGWGQQVGGLAPVTNPANPAVSAGRIKIDVVVTDKAGRPVTGLQPQDFTLLDDKTPRKTSSFQAFDGVSIKPDQPTEVILLFDYVNETVREVAAERFEVQKFLRENGGHLAQPTSIFLLQDSGLQALRQPTTDGNALAEAVAKMDTSFRVNSRATGSNGAQERYAESLHALSGIAAYEKQRPGRKLLLWIGYGWPTLSEPTNDAMKQYFKSIVEYSTSLREARINVYSVGIVPRPVQTFRRGESNGEIIQTSAIYNPFAYQEYLKGVDKFWRSRAANLYVKVLAAQNGGRVLGLDNDLKSQIDSCIQDANAFYTLSFNPPQAAQPNEYHSLKVQLDRPGLIARTNTGYYNQP
jgi:VWFA-related protein